MKALSRIFSSEERIKVLRYVLYINRPFGVIDVTRDVGVSQGLASEYLKLLYDFDILNRTGTKYSTKDNAVVRSIKTLLNVFTLNVKELKEFLNEIEGFGIYGSWATGTNTVDSDIDVWVRVKSHPGDLWAAKLADKIRELTLAPRVDLIILTPDKIEKLRGKKLYEDMKNGIILYGGGI